MDPAPGTQPDTSIDLEDDRRRARTADIFATVVGMLLLTAAALYLGYWGLWVSSVTWRCGGNYICNEGLVSAGLNMAAFGPVVVWVVALIGVIVLLALRRRAWWVAPAALLVAFAAQNIGSWLARYGANVL